MPFRSRRRKPPPNNRASQLIRAVRPTHPNAHSRVVRRPGSGSRRGHSCRGPSSLRRDPRIVKDREGDVEVVKSYVDGIFGTDPAKIVVRSRGATHVETETKYFRDASFVCAISRCIIAAQDSPFAVIPEQLWILDGISLRSQDSPGGRPSPLDGPRSRIWTRVGVSVGSGRSHTPRNQPRAADQFSRWLPCSFHHGRRVWHLVRLAVRSRRSK
jgi:hypothetical protein